MLVCVPLITLNLASLLLGRKWASAALGRKTAFGRSPRVHWEGRGQRISVSPRHGTGCEEIVGNVNNGTKRSRAAAGSPCSRTIWISMLEKIKSNYASLFFKPKQWHLWRQWRLFNLYTIRIKRNGEDYWVFLSLILMFNNLYLHQKTQAAQENQSVFLQPSRLRNTDCNTNVSHVFTSSHTSAQWRAVSLPSHAWSTFKTKGTSFEFTFVFSSCECCFLVFIQKITADLFSKRKKLIK